jgi:transposase
MKRYNLTFVLNSKSKVATNVQNLILAAGCKCEYLPPYSPDYNPIEYSFSVIKKALKGCFQLKGNETLKELGDKVTEIAKNVVTSEIARNQFRHCRIHMD